MRPLSTTTGRAGRLQPCPRPRRSSHPRRRPPERAMPPRTFRRGPWSCRQPLVPRLHRPRFHRVWGVHSRSLRPRGGEGYELVSLPMTDQSCDQFHVIFFRISHVRFSISVHYIWAAPRQNPYKVCVLSRYIYELRFFCSVFALSLLMLFTRFTALRIKVQCRGFIKRTSRQSLLDQVQDLFTTEHTLTTVSWLVSRLAAPHARLRVAVGRE